MAPPTKRTRSAAAADSDEDEAQHRRDETATPPASDSAASTHLQTPPRRAIPRRSPARRAAAAALANSNANATPSTGSAMAERDGENAPPSTPTPQRTTSAAATRTPRTRISLSSASPSLMRASSASALFRTPSRGANSSATGSMASPDVLMGVAGPSSSIGTRSSGGILTRAASMSAVPVSASPSATLGQIKEAVAGSGGSAPPPAKGGSDPDGTPGPSSRGWGKGKENIPPPKDVDPPPESSSRKRLRVSRRNSVTPSRQRSASVVSVRSESAGPSSVGPSSSFDFSGRRTSSCLPSPSPSPSVATTASTSTYERITSPNAGPLETIDDDAMDVDATPTKKGKRPVRSLRSSTTTSSMLLTPPPSSPISADVVNALESVNVHSSRDTSRSLSRDSTPLQLNAYRTLKAALRLSSAPAGASSSSGDTIVGREDEKAVLQSYLSLVSSCDVGMYISGPPGTGKTAMTTAVGRELAAQGWRVAEVGVMGLKASDVWARIGDDLGCGHTEEEVTAHLAQPGSRTLIILDEVDSLMPPAPALPTPATSHVLSKLFSLPLISAAGDATVKLVAISNTLDLTVRANLVLADGAMPQVLAFRAYNATDMAAIVSARIAAVGDGPETAKVDARAVELLCRKVEAQNGDLRMCLGVLSSAVGLAEAEWVKKTGDNAATDRPLVKVALPHILKAFTSHTQQLRAAAGSSAVASASPTASKIRSVPLQGRMVLVSLLVFLMRTRAGLPGCPAGGATSEQLTASNLYATYAHLLSHVTSPFPPSPESDYRDLLSNLETLGLVKVAAMGNGAGRAPGRTPRAAAHGLGPRVELCVREEEVKDGLGITAATGDLDKLGMAEQEVLGVWRREDERIARVRARAAAAIERAVHGLEEPF